MEQDQVISKVIAKKAQLDKSFVVSIRQGTSKKEVYDLLRHYQLRNFKVTDIRISNLRPLDNSLPYILDITFVKCDIGTSPSIIELPLAHPLATSTPLRPLGDFSFNWSGNLSPISATSSNLDFDLGSDQFSAYEVLRDTRFGNLTDTINFSLRDFAPIKLFEGQSTPKLEYFNIPLPAEDDSFKSAQDTGSQLQLSIPIPILNLSTPVDSVNMPEDDGNFKAKFKMSPPNFSGSYKEDVRDWVEKFERAARINHWMKEEEKARFLPCFLTGSANIWYENLEHTAGSDMTKFNELKDALVKAFDVTKIHDALEYELRNRRQQPDEEVSHYYYDILKLCRRVNPKMANETITRHLMFGLNEKLVPLVIMQANATPADFLTNAIKAERAQIYAPGNNTEMAKLSKQMEELACSLTPKVNEIKAVDSKPVGDKNATGYPVKRGMGVVCYYCNKSNHMQRECRLRLRDLKGKTSRGGQNRYYYSRNGGANNGGVNNGFQGANYDRDYPQGGNYYDKNRANRNYNSRPQNQRSFLPPHVQNYRRNYSNNRGAQHNVNMVDSNNSPHVSADHHSHNDQESKNE